MKKFVTILVVLAVLVFGVFLNNTSLLVSSDGEKPFLMAHRGVHQTYDKTGIDDKTCTAKIIDKPSHAFLENTLPSIQAAFEAGADMVEIDIHPTTDGHFAVFHDWTIDCRTEGTGTTRSHSLEYLKTLDIGYGYTADKGKTFPFRGKAVGMIPSLTEVLARFPDKSFLINFKSKDPEEGERLAKLVKTLPETQVKKMMVYGGDAPTNRFVELTPAVRGFSKKSVKGCLIDYALLGWSGYVPQGCRKTGVVVPINYAHWLWGWPDRFIARMKSVDTRVFVLGELNKAGSMGGLDSVEQVKQLPEGYSGGIWTDKIEVVGEYFGR